MTEKELKESMSILYDEFSKLTNKNSAKIVIAKAVQLGMKYQTEKIKQGINIVFQEL